MSLMQIFNVSGSAASAQGQRLNTVASNLANADSIAEPGAQPYRARQVVFQTLMMGNAGSAGIGGGDGNEDGASAGVRVSNIVVTLGIGRGVAGAVYPPRLVEALDDVRHAHTGRCAVFVAVAATAARRPGVAHQQRLEHHLPRPVRLGAWLGNRIGVGQVRRDGVQTLALRRGSAA